MTTVEIIAIGDELLSGETVDTNSSHADFVFEGHGYTVLRHHTVADDVEVIAGALREASRRAKVVLTTGGLGPTRDDVTFEGLGRAMGVPLEHDASTWSRIEARYASFGRTPTENNRRQAQLPRGSEVLVNEVGTAPGLRAELGGATVFVLPGVPREMRWLLEHQVLPRLTLGEPVRRRTLKVAGIGESALEAELAPVLAEHPSVRFGFRTRVFENQLKILARGAEAEAQLAAAEQAARQALGSRCFGVDDATLESAVLDALRSADQTVATAESCTGGWISKLLTDVPGSSSSVMGGVVAYANEVKVSLLGVELEALEAQGAVSEVVARQMAEGVRARLSTTWGLSSTGVAGPGGGTEDKPVGTVWLALAGPSGTEAWRLPWPARTRETIRLATAKSALERLRRTILDARH